MRRDAISMCPKSRTGAGVFFSVQFKGKNLQLTTSAKGDFRVHNRIATTLKLLK